MRSKRYIIEIDNNEIIEYVVMNLDPEEVYSERTLNEWASENGWVREDK